MPFRKLQTMIEYKAKLQGEVGVPLSVSLYEFDLL